MCGHSKSLTYMENHCKETCLCFQHSGTRHQPRTDLQPKFCAFNFSKLCSTRLLTTWSVIPTCFLHDSVRSS